MKTTLPFAALMLLSGVAMAASEPRSSPETELFQSLSTSLKSPVFEAAGRKGSRRVGGSGKSGKGGKYVGGRK